MEGQKDLIGQRVSGHAQQPQSIEQRLNASEDETMVDYPLDKTYTYKRKLYYPGDKIPVSMARNLEKRASSRDAGKQLDKLAKEATNDIAISDSKTVYADDMDIPEGFPGLEALAENGYTRIGDVKTIIADLESLPGIGTATAGKIRKTLNLVINEEQ
ncbi:MAG: hypothetical protein GY938_12930 [Ketobacter sp.]|nr:hypothetical protein [Ketobacter sp.]